MASVTMAASFLAAPIQTQRKLIIGNGNRVSVKANSPVKVSSEMKQDGLNNNNNNNKSSGRREMLFAVAAAAIWSTATGVVAVAPPPALAEEPKRGSPQAKKAYGPVCVANPTAKICHY